MYSLYKYDKLVAYIPISCIKDKEDIAARYPAYLGYRIEPCNRIAHTIVTFNNCLGKELSCK